MDDKEPAQRKRKVEITTTPPRTVMYGFTVVDGMFVRVEKPLDDTSGCSSDDDVDPALVQEYYRQIRESDGFDLNMRIPNGEFLPFKLTNEEDLHDEIGICARVGLHWYNFQRGSDLRLVRLVKYNSVLRGLCAYYITMEAMDPANGSHLTFQTCVVRVVPWKNEENKIITEACRIKPKPEGDQASEDDDWRWDDKAVDDFHNGELEWLSHDALTGDKQKQYYQVQESEIRENDWLNLYAEFAFHSILEERLTKKFNSPVPLKIKKVVVQTREDVESSEKLKSENAVFYISFSDSGEIEEHRAVLRRVTDGIQGHVALEVKVKLADLSSSSSSIKLV